MKSISVHAVVLGVLGVLCGSASAQAPATGPATQPVTKVGGAIGELLRKWYAEGTAAGNVGDFYDNRDRAHSDLNMQPYPQLQRIKYDGQALARRLDWAMQRRIIPAVVFGNSSTSSGVAQGGSNVRSYYVNPNGLAFLCQQYMHNNIYIYPEHLDHDPGHNGSGGYGDLYPVNTPYLIAAQGSSGSDQPFLRAIPLALAAFRPEVKAKLAASGLLMPTLQVLFRTTNRRLLAGAATSASPPAAQSPYLTGRAHPSVFEGAWVNDLKMIEMAHAIRADNLPPMVQIKVVQEEQSTERLSDTPCVVGWIFRGVAQSRKVTLSAQDSFDLNKRPLTYYWVLLRGDPQRVKIRPLNGENSAVEVTVAWQPRRPVEPGSATESNRVDLGAFVHNGAYYSAPGFATWFFLDDEARTYADDGRPLEIACGMGETVPAVGNWVGLLDLLKAQTPPAGIVRKAFTDAQLETIAKVGEDYRKAAATVEEAQKKVKDIEVEQRKGAAAVKKAQTATASAPATGPADAEAGKARAELAAAQERAKAVEKELAAARKALDAANRSAEEVLNRKADGQKTFRQAVEGGLRALIEDPDFYPANAAALDELLKSADGPRKAAVAKARKRLVGYGLLKDGEEGFALQPILPAAAASTAPATTPAARLTDFERALVAQYNGELLGGLVCPGMVNCSFRRNFVDQRLAQPKSYRDVYHYDSAGRCTGLTRYDGEKAAEFPAASMPAGTR